MRHDEDGARTLKLTVFPEQVEDPYAVVKISSAVLYVWRENGRATKFEASRVCILF